MVAPLVASPLNMCLCYPQIPEKRKIDICMIIFYNWVLHNNFWVCVVVFFFTHLFLSRLLSASKSLNYQINIFWIIWINTCNSNKLYYNKSKFKSIYSLNKLPSRKAINCQCGNLIISVIHSRIQNVPKETKWPTSSNCHGIIFL